MESEMVIGGKTYKIVSAKDYPPAKGGRPKGSHNRKKSAEEQLERKTSQLQLCRYLLQKERAKTKRLSAKLAAMRDGLKRIASDARRLASKKTAQTAALTAFLALGACQTYAFAPVDYHRLYTAIAAVESDGGRTSGNRYQLSLVYVKDVERITGTHFPILGIYTQKYAEKAMLCYWLYYGSRYEARTGRAATAEILAKIHHVGYRGLWTKPTAAARYWAKVRRHYEKGEASK